MRSFARLFLFSSIAFLIGQGTLIYLITLQGTGNNHVNRGIEAIKTLLEAADRLSISLVLTDPKQLTENDTDLIYPRRITFFILNVEQEKIVVLSLSGFEVSVILAEVPRGANIKNVSTSQIPVHFVVQTVDTIFHLVPLYERGDNPSYWWHGAVHPSDSAWNSLAEFNVTGVHEGAFKKFQVDRLKSHLGSVGIPSDQDLFQIQKNESTFVECNSTRAELFFKRNPHHQTDFRNKVWKILFTVKGLLDKLDVPFWLSSGTCLGYYRQCDVIPYSGDVDIGIWIKNYKEDIVPTFSSHGLPQKHWFGKVNDSLELSFMFEDVKLDLFFFYEETDYMWNGGTQARTGKKFKYIFPKFTMCWTEFLGLRVRIPCETESYIRANYGSDWFTPQQSWDWKSSPPNVVGNGHWDASEWHEVIRVYDVLHS